MPDTNIGYEDRSFETEVNPDILNRLCAEIELKHGNNATTVIFTRSNEEFMAYFSALIDKNSIKDVEINVEELAINPELDSLQQSQVWFHKIIDPLENNTEPAKGVLFIILPFDRNDSDEQAIGLLFDWLNQARNTITAEGADDNCRLTCLVVPENDLEAIRQRDDLFSCCGRIFLS